MPAWYQSKNAPADPHGVEASTILASGRAMVVGIAADSISSAGMNAASSQSRRSTLRPRTAASDVLTASTAEPFESSSLVFR